MLSEMSPEERNRKLGLLRTKYRETFSTDDDLVVLFDILNECGEWETFNARNRSNEVRIALLDLSRYIQFMLGGRQEMNGIRLLRAQMQLPYSKETQ